METFALVGAAILFLLILYIGFLIGKFISRKEMEEKIPAVREEAIKQSRAVLSGQFSEQIAPFLPDFPYKPTEARFIGKPIDFIIFRGMDEKKIEEVVFVEVKTGKSSLNNSEKSLKDTIQNKKISWDEYRVPTFEKES